MSWNNVIPWEVLECQSMCWLKDHSGVLHEKECPIGKKLKEREENGSKKNSIGDSEKPKVVGGAVQVGYAGVKPGSPDSDPNW